MKYRAGAKLIALFLSCMFVFTCLLSCRKSFSEDVDFSENSSESESFEHSGTLKDDGEALKSLTRDEIFKKLKPSILKVICYDFEGKKILSQGSGFFIDENGTFITNAHVVENCYRIKVQTYFGSMYDVDVMYKYSGESSDYAICGIEVEYSSLPVEFTTSAKVGDTVYAVGYPNDAYVMSNEAGKILTTDAIEGTKHYYVNTAEIDHGSSGGALVDEYGRVLGITTGVAAEGAYVALKYEDFKADLDISHNSGKEPARYFHNVRDYTFAQSSMMLYFDIYVNIIDYADSYLDYSVGVKLKDEYLNSKIDLDMDNTTTITVELKTTYDYDETVDTNIIHRSKTTVGTVYLTFDSLAELREGKELPISSSISDSIPENYSNMNISYDAQFWVLQTGKISIYV